MDFNMTTIKSVNQFILFPTTQNVGISTTIEFLYCLSCEILSIQSLYGVHFPSPRWRPTEFSVQTETLVFWFQKGLTFSNKFERKYIATLTNMEKRRGRIGTVKRQA